VLLPLQVSVKLHLDDPLDAIAVHAWNGTWGVIAVGFFASQRLIQVRPVYSWRPLAACAMHAAALGHLVLTHL
jgi:ammonia channel protein AmtB